MGVIGLTAIEVLAYCLGAGLVLAILVVLCNCVSTCWETFQYRRKKQKVEKLPDDYVDEIHQLLQRNRNNCQYDCVVVDSKRTTPNIEYIEDTRLSQPIPPPIKIRQKTVEFKENTPIRVNEEINNSNTNSSQSTIAISEPDEMAKEEQKRRRTWGRLSNSMFDTVFMPSVDTTTTEDSLETRISPDTARIGMKIETTV